MAVHTLALVTTVVQKKKSISFNAHTAATSHPDAAVWTDRLPVFGQCLSWGIRPLVCVKNNSDEVDASVYENRLRRKRRRHQSAFTLAVTSLCTPQQPHLTPLGQSSEAKTQSGPPESAIPPPPHFQIFTHKRPAGHTCSTEGPLWLPPCGIVECWKCFFPLPAGITRAANPEPEMVPLDYCRCMKSITKARKTS